MLTQCPSCQTTFRVTSEILRVAQGQVRCGRCQTQFDALARLIEETDDGGVESGRYMRPPRQAPAPPPQRGEIEVDEPVEHEDITLEGRHIEISGTYETLDESGSGVVHQEMVEDWVEIDDTEEEPADEEAEAEVEAEEEPEAIDLQEEYAAVEVDDDTDTDEDIEAAIEEMAAAERTSQSGQWSSSPSIRRMRAASAAAASATASATASDFDLTPPRPRTKTATVWKVLAAPLAVLLLVQVIHNYRATLARHPQLGPPLLAIYGALGLTLRPDWDLHAYEVRQWGVVSDSSTPGTLKVRASVTNLAQFAQPYPMLRLVLEDRWGEQVRAREFQPSEYLDPMAAPDRLLAPAQQANATIAIVDPGPDAEGFRFDVCLQGARGPVCATDVPKR